MSDETSEDDGQRPATGGAPAPDLPDRRILVVEDSPEVALLVAEHLRQFVREVIVRGDGRAALDFLQRERIDLMVLDLVLPEVGGLEVCRAVRAAGKPMPILMLTGRSTELDRIVGLEFGADDYMVKPFSVLELLARVRALFRRTEMLAASAVLPPPRRTVMGGLVIDFQSREVFREGVSIALTEKEFDLLSLFASNPGRVYARAHLLDMVWGYGSSIYEYTVTSHINRLRAKIEPDPAHPTLIQTVWGVGYRLQAPSEPGRRRG